MSAQQLTLELDDARISAATIWGVHHPGYIDWEDYVATQERLRANARVRGEGGGAAREGSALLQGLVRCGQCGRRMMVAYSGVRGRAGRYLCSRTFQQQGTRRPCQAIGALRVDRAVTQAFLDAVTPAGVDATAHALQTLQSAHDERVQLQRLAVEHAAFQAERARRQYDACEPENRLVARTLEHTLEAALVELDTQQRVARELERRRPAPLSDHERRALVRLAADLPRVWQARTTTDRDRKQLLRCLLDDVVLTVDREQRRARLELFWQGGAHTELDIALNRTPAKRTDTSEELVALIRRLSEHSSDAEVAMILAKQGRRTATDLAFTASRVAGIRERAHIPAGRGTQPIAILASQSTTPPVNSASAPKPSAAGCAKASCPPSKPPHTRPGASNSPTTSAAASSPKSLTATSASPTPQPAPASPAKPSSTKSAAATATPSTSPKANAGGSASNSIPMNKAS